MENLVATLGYLGVLIGVVVEGEVAVLTATYLASRGLLSPVGIGVTAFAGSVATYNACFWLGRRHGRAVLAARPAWRSRVEYARLRLARHELAFILGYRFLFGLRAATPFALGLSGTSPRRFLLFDTPVAAVWAIGLVLLGLAFGRGLEAIAGRFQDWVSWAILALLAVATVWLMRRGWHLYRRRTTRSR